VIGLATDGYYGGGSINVAGVTYRMRGKDGTLGRLVFWNSTSIDSSGTDYTGPGPLTDIVVQMVIGNG
jgi:hypothetical protein